MPRVRRLLTKFRQADDGAVLVELSLVVPFLIALSAGVFEFSNIIHTRLLLEAGVEDAARYMARCPGSWSDCIASAKNLAVTGTIDGSGDVRVTDWTTANVTVSPDVACSEASSFCIKSTAEDGTKLYRSDSGWITIVQVSASIPYTGSGLLAYLGFSPLTLSVSHEERVLGW
jgi:Flp pilus assembly protein TadG